VFPNRLKSINKKKHKKKKMNEKEYITKKEFDESMKALEKKIKKMNTSNEPKEPKQPRPSNDYNKFMKERIAKIKEENPTINPREAFRQGASEWSLKKAEKEKTT
jgi:hypothetical protein